MKPPKWSSYKGDERSVRKWFLAYDLQETEDYLNEMIAIGWCPIRVSGNLSYTFVPCEPGAYICRTVAAISSYGAFDKNKAAGLEDLLIDDGAFIVEQRDALGFRIGIIALRSATLGAFEITTDIDSRIAEYEARRKYQLGFTALWLVFAVIYFFTLSLPFLLKGPHPAASEDPLLFVGYLIAPVGTMIASGLFLVSSLFYGAPVRRYNKAIARLRAQRDVSEV